MKTWTNPEVEELEVALTAGGCSPWFWESCLTHGPSCGGNHGNNNGNENENPEGDGTNGDQEIEDGELEEGTPS